MTSIIDEISCLYNKWAGGSYAKCTPLPRSGSDRQYFRLTTADQLTVMAAYNPNVAENEAYFSFSRAFADAGINVPKVLAESADRTCYLIEDLGSEPLYNLVTAANGTPDEHLKQLYRQALADLARMQVVAGRNIDYSLCIPTADFDQTAIRWDLNYFKYCFLKNAHIAFDEYRLEQDFNRIIDAASTIDSQYFMFRDFQSRNIMLKNDELYYIDFQGCKRGPLMYDVASLLYQAKARFSETLRNGLFDSYITALKELMPVNRDKLFGEFKLFALIRTLQVLGAYGYRGYFEQKKHFIESIPAAAKNLKDLLALKFIDLPHIEEIANLIDIAEPQPDNFDGLTVTVYSFSYKKGIPSDSENGGGFVFDCRGQHNPGRYDEYKALTGRDKPVIDFLKSNSTIDSFLEQAIGIVSPTIETYLRRGFKNLMVSFGCTGGQHRSVYCAQNFAEQIGKKFDVRVKLIHRELGIRS